ncbi:glycerate kinase [Luteipulveratus flavus]|uniref:Glycerate kinase n=1 Tax=Luteipulveratus flavus TaxID=3031728 RepID=A0ABT6C9M9_9MICO|nr:glycerate kinase [Luteipulveratus sp. YIM 133296]MDF8265605.1 glycerate kinase [Luteipulveratus sp. YIM 133296]
MFDVILVAPDSFKGSATAPEVAAALARGLRRALPERTQVREVPVSDGGDSLLDVLRPAGFEPVTSRTVGPTGAPLDSTYAVRGDTAVVELAAASGLSRLPGGRPDPLGASSYGTGLQVAQALDGGARTVVLGLGGSACTDGGAGLLEALGARLLEADGRPVARGGAALAEVTSVSLDEARRRCGNTEIVLACDVDNPLLGKHGAATVFGPQKGASADQIGELDAALARWARAVERAYPDAAGRSETPGAGAAGGTAYGALVGCGATISRGTDVVLDLLDIDALLPETELVITGEGRLDDQTLRGKAPAGVTARATAAGVPVVLVAGRVDLTAQEVRRLGAGRAYALTDLCADPERSMREATGLLERVGEQIAADLH